jgi:hypothetical protein
VVVCGNPKNKKGGNRRYSTRAKKKEKKMIDHLAAKFIRKSILLLFQNRSFIPFLFPARSKTQEISVQKHAMIFKLIIFVKQI